MDEIITFKPLSEEDLEKIAALMLDEYKPGLAAHGITLHYTQPALADIVAESSTKYGARELRRTIRKTIEDPVSDALVDGRWMAARSRWSWPTTTAGPCWKFKGRTMYRKLAAWCWPRRCCAAARPASRCSVIPQSCPGPKAPPPPPTPEPVPTFTEEQKPTAAPHC